MKLHFSVVIVALLHFSMNSYAQIKEGPDTRTIVLNFADSVIHAGILTDKTEYESLNNRLYYWYYPECINTNVGGYSGYLLHDDYSVYNKDKQLIEQGFFNKGLKNGIWKRWYPTGGLSSVVSWKDGLLDGILIYYGDDGSVYLTGEYKNGKKDGVTEYIENNVVTRKYYKSGVEVIKEPAGKTKTKPRTESNTEVITTPADTITIEGDNF
jgi:antitoxin component YwqK of YwqJK toxin-antitoxin module